MTYEYLCTECLHEWEADQKITDDALTKCPKCGKDKAKRLISGGIGIIFKGGGWTPKGN
jgi:putative FmdB family regulatory protein